MGYYVGRPYPGARGEDNINKNINIQYWISPEQSAITDNVKEKVDASRYILIGLVQNFRNIVLIQKATNMALRVQYKLSWMRLCLRKSSMRSLNL